MSNFKENSKVSKNKDEAKGKLFTPSELIKIHEKIFVRMNNFHKDSKLYKAFKLLVTLEQSVLLGKEHYKKELNSQSKSELSNKIDLKEVKNRFSFFDNFFIQTSKENKFLMKRIKREYAEAKKLSKELYNLKDWKLASHTSSGIKTYIKFGKDFSLRPHSDKKSDSGKISSIRIEGDIEASILNVLALFYEIDLYKTWVPRMKKCHKISNLGIKFCFLCYYAWDLFFPFSDRDIICLGYGIDILEEENRLLGVIRSVDEEEFEELEKIDKTIKLPKKVGSDVRIDCNYCGFEVIPISRNKCHVKIMSSINPKVSYIPVWLVNFITKMSCPYVIEKLRSLAKEVEKTEHGKRLKKNKEIYDDIIFRMEKNFSKLNKK